MSLFTTIKGPRGREEEKCRIKGFFFYKLRVQLSHSQLITDNKDALARFGVPWI